MATVNGGTNADNSLTGLQWEPGGLADADIATIASYICDDILGTFSTVWQGAFSRAGLLYVPNRGVLKMQPGDWVLCDTNSNWPILISANVAQRAGTPWNV